MHGPEIKVNKCFTLPWPRGRGKNELNDEERISCRSSAQITDGVGLGQSRLTAMSSGFFFVFVSCLA
jgi:hypothetical protein